VSHYPIKKLFDSFNGKRIFIVGDVMVDSYLWGKVDRISPEAPVPVVACRKREDRLGGAANVALNIKALGAVPILCSVIGDDPAGKIFATLLEKEGMLSGGILTDPGRATTRKTRIISSNQQLLRVDEEDTHYLPQEVGRHMIARIEDLLKDAHADALVFQDYDKGMITPPLIETIIGICKKIGVPVLVDPKRRNYNYYQEVDLFKPNFKEFCEGSKLTLHKEDEKGILQAARTFLDYSGNKSLLLTLSEHGVLFVNGGTYHAVPAHVRDIADVSGAGDTVISVAALCLAAGAPPRILAEIVNLAGGLVCEKVGVVPVDRELLLAEALKLNL
jgi:rfaE bifunctional protein kinase chain/domain